jgi:hypothetical protein
LHLLAPEFDAVDLGELQFAGVTDLPPIVVLLSMLVRTPLTSKS